LFVVPLSVLVIDLWVKGKIPEPDLYLTLALYIIATGASSRSIALMAASIVLTGGYLVAYGRALDVPDCPPLTEAAYKASLFIAQYGPASVFTVFGVAERYNRHVAEIEKFWAFE
jgi:hypothetical protein